jgi:hypothetical protein
VDSKSGAMRLINKVAEPYSNMVLIPIKILISKGRWQQYLKAPPSDKEKIFMYLATEVLASVKKKKKKTGFECVSI